MILNQINLVANQIESLKGLRKNNELAQINEI
jgi:hypothetical protein